MVQKKMVPPDGGWGWVVVLATAVSNICVIPIIQSFGLLFKDAFDSFGFSHTDGSIILNVNNAFCMLTGIVHGALLKYFGYRKIAVVGSLLTMLGVILTSFATTFAQFMIYYGIITSFGMGLCISAYSLALNSYFTKKRGKAVSISMTITGVGPVLMPQLISYLLSVHTTQGATLIIGALCGHSVVAAFLLQPIKWHLKEEDVEEEAGLIAEKTDNPKIDEELDTEAIEERKDVVQSEIPVQSVAEADKIPPGKLRQRRISNAGRRNSIVDSTHSIDHDQELGSIYGMDTPTVGSIISLGPERPRVFRRESSEQQTVNRWWSTPSIHTINMQSSIDIFDEKPVNNEISKPEDVKTEKTVCRNIWWNVVNFFDLTLLLDPIYVNIMMGMSLAIFAEINFSVLTPFILADFGLNTAESATFLSVLSVADIAFRFCAPYIGEFLKKPPRMMYMLTLFLLILTRFSLLLFTNYYHLLVVALGLGVAKGVRTVYMSLVIPSYVPIERLASAAGIQMMVNGVCILVGGPLLGVIRDVTGSYRACIIIMNCVTFSCIALWTSEIVYLKIRKNE